MHVLDPIRQFITLTEAEAKTVANSFERVELKKNESFLKLGEVCRKVAFVEKGVLIYLRTNEEGKEVAADFAFKNDWVTYYYSLLSSKPSDMEIRTHERATLFVVTKEKLNLLYETLPKMERVGRILAEQNFVQIAERALSLQSMPASQRYEELIRLKPLVLEKIPQYYIASYLGVKSQSLSRLRKK